MKHDHLSEKIVIFGHLGLLGQTLLKRLGARAVGVDRQECDVTDPAAIAALLDEVRPASMVNCVAYTAVDQAESEAETAWKLNVDVVANLAQAASQRQIHFITLSTDYVFNGEGDRPFPEDASEWDFGPQSVYGRTKLEGELRLRQAGGLWCLVRTQWLYGAGGKNFIDRVVELAKARPALRIVNDQVGAPTWTHDLAEGIAALIEQRVTGVYHLVNSGYASWYEVARHVVDRLGLGCEITPCTSEEYPTPVRRPKNSCLAQDKYIALTGQPLRPWREALDQYLETRRADYRLPAMDHPQPAV